MLYLKNYKFYIVLFLTVIFVFWIFFGGEKKKFIGLEKYYEERIKLREEILKTDTFEKKLKTNIINTNNWEKPTVKKRISKGEKECKRCLEEIFQKKFISVRPDFLKNPETGRNLELDCYNEELKLAVEYNGKQHYIHPNSFHKTSEEFIKQVRRDIYKKETCKKYGIKLIIVPYTVKKDKIKEYILERIHSSEN